MIHLYYSEQDIMVKEFAKRAVKIAIKEPNEFNYIALDMGQVSFEEAAFECESLPLGYDKKCVVLENCQFFKKSAGGARKGKATTKKKHEDGRDSLLDYLSHPNPDIELFFLAYEKEVDLNGEFYQAIERAGGDIQSVAPLDSNGWLNYIANFFKKRGVSIDSNALRELNIRINGDYGAFKNETQKLLTYSGGGRISLSDVEKLVPPYVEDDVFKMSNALTRNNVRMALKIYKDLKVLGVGDEVRLLNLLTNQFRYMDMVYYLDSKGESSGGIAKKLGGSPYRVEITLKNLYGVSPGMIGEVLEQLYQAERAILVESQDASFVFSNFLANFHL